MTVINIRGLPEELYKILKKKAENENRSINQEIIWLLKKSILSESEDLTPAWSSIDQRRTKLLSKNHSNSVDILRKDRRR